MRHGGAGGDQRRIVAGNVGDDERRDAGRSGKRGEAAALDGAQLVADDVHHGDRRAGGEEDAVDLLLVLESEARCRLRQQGRAAAGDQRDDQIVVAEARDLFHHAAGGEKAREIGDRVGGLDDFDALASAP